ncbi:MAG: lysylphosphatidylglycerol synthase transmembrane domain-containing protein [archaeon]
MKNRFGLILKLSLGLLILYFILKKVGVTELVNTISQIDIFFLPMALFFFLLTLFLGALNLYFLLCYGLNIKLKFFRILKYSLLSWSFGMFIPGKLGEFSFAYFLKKRKVPVWRSFIILTMDKIITLFTLLSLTFIGFYLFLSVNQFLNLLIFFLIFGMIFFYVLIIFKEKNWLKRFLPKKFALSISQFSNGFFYMLKKRKKLLFLNTGLTFTKWFLSGIFHYFLFLSLGFDLNFGIVFLITAMVTIISLIPISISGLGVRESAAVYLYSLFLIPVYISLGVALIAVTTSYIISILFFISLRWR